MRSAEPGQRSLIEAGRRLLATEDLARLSVNAIVAEANMAKGSFYQHWRTRTDYFVALHATFHGELFDAFQSARQRLEPGLDRLTAGVTAYLDGCLANPATKALLVQARTDAALGPHVAACNEKFTQLVLTDLRALGWDPAEPVTILLVEAVSAIALHEVTAGRPLPELRTAALQLAARKPTPESTS